MIKELRLENYRGFEDHTIPFGELTILIGRNNAGKSTAVEALRLVGTVVRRFRSSAAFAGAPRWLDDEPRAFRGVQPAVPELDFDEDSFFYGYGRGPATVTATFENGTSVNVFVGPLGDIHGVARAPDGHAANSAAQARALELPDVRVQPQYGPVLRDETILMRNTVIRGLWTTPSIHFRNQINLFYQHFPDFKTLAEETWPEIQVREFVGEDGDHGDRLRLIVRDGAFAADVGLMGSGLQMWLQTIWFLASVPRESCVVLDEPDVYMHPDMQHRLLAKIDGRYRQVVIATHSTEMISSSDPGSLVVVDRTRKKSRPLMSLSAAQAAIEELGGVHNVHVSRLFRSERFLMIEGDDIPLLGTLQQTLIPTTRAALAAMPAYEMGGWGGWHHAIKSKLPATNGEGRPITTYCILDSDYHAEEEISDRYAEALAANIELYIWKRKEIENYVVVPDAIDRLIRRRTKKRSPRDEEIAAAVEASAQSLLDDTTDSLAEELHRRNRALGVKGARAKAKQQLRQKIDDSGITAVVSGKTLVSTLSAWAQKQFGVSFSALTLARELRPDEVDAEMRTVLEAIERRGRLTPRP